MPKVRTEAERQADRKADLWAGRAVVVDVVVVVGFSWGTGPSGSASRAWEGKEPLVEAMEELGEGN